MPLGIDFVQILLHLFNVIILFGGLYYILFGPVKKFMDQREEHYRQLDEEKTQALADAQKMKEDYDKQLQASADQILVEKQKATREIQELRRQKVTEAQEEARRIIKKAEGEGNRRKEEIVAGAREEISNLIADAADKLLQDGDTDDFYDAFLDEVERGAEHE
jgi:F-type H+-transporting ATPase subunit b